MKLIGIMLARDEAWCIGFAARVALAWCDELVVLDHRSTDATPEILEQIGREHPGRLVVEREDDAPFNEAAMRQRLMMRARSRGMTHAAIIDADEALTANLIPIARALVARARPGEVPHIPMRSPHGTLDAHRVDEAFGNKWISVWFKDDPAYTFRTATDGYHYHARLPAPPDGPRHTYMHFEKFGLAGGCWHLQTISRRRLEVKSACYKALERVHFPGRHTAAQLEDMYGWTLRAPVALADSPRDWVDGYRSIVGKHLDLTSEPWQLHELRRLLETRPREHFADLDLYQVA